MTLSTGGFGLDAKYIQRAMAAWDVPGLSIAVVKDGQTVYSQGFGVLKKGAKAPVNRDSLFTIGSCTKAFTTVAISMLVQDGKLSWDDPVIKYIPDFQLSDAKITAELTLKDMVSHQSGIEDGAITNIPAKSYKKACKHLAGIKPVRAHRGGFSYNNTMFAILGKVVEKVSGMSWSTFLQTRILDPLAMDNSFPTRKACEGHPNQTSAHIKPAGKRTVKVMDAPNLDFLASSAGLQSNITDMAAWLKFQLGHIGHGKLCAQSELEAMHSEQLQVEPNPFTLMMHPGSTRHGYGMAWFVRDYGGIRIVQHGGYVDGYTSFTVMGPAKDFGVVVLTNMHNSLLPFALAYRVIDAYLDIAETDWSGYFLEKRAEHRNKVSPHDKENARQEKVNRRCDKRDMLKARCKAKKSASRNTAAKKNAAKKGSKKR